MESRLMGDDKQSRDSYVKGRGWEENSPHKSQSRIVAVTNRENSINVAVSSSYAKQGAKRLKGCKHTVMDAPGTSEFHSCI